MKKIGLVSTDMTYQRLSQALGRSSDLFRITSIEDVYYYCFSGSRAKLQGLIIDESIQTEALVKLAKCLDLHFPNMPLVLLSDNPSRSLQTNLYTYPNNEEGYRELIQLIASEHVKESASSNEVETLTPSEYLEQKYELMINSLGEAIIGIDRYGRITFVNSYACELFEESEQSLLGSHLSDFALDSPLAEGSSAQSFTGEGRTRRRVGRGVIKRNDGKMTCVEFTQTYVGNASDETVSVMVIEDINARVKFEAKLRSMASQDPLTGLYNRHYFKRAFIKAMNTRRKNQTVGALICLDLDGFKSVNDEYGHIVGDKLLVSVAERLKANCRRVDLVARFGGDEFLILTDMSEREEVQRMVSHLLASLNEAHFIDGLRLSVTASIGVTFLGENVTNLESAISAADNAMYQVKNTGKANYAIAGAIGKM